MYRDWCTGIESARTLGGERECGVDHVDDGLVLRELR